MKGACPMRAIAFSSLALLLAFSFVRSLPAACADEPVKTFLDKAKAVSEAAKVDLARFPDAETVLIDDYEYAEYKADGSARKYDESYEKVLTEKGKRQLRTISLHYDTHYTRVSLPVLELIKPDGRCVVVDVAKNSREMVERSQMGANIYDPNEKVLEVTVPDLEIGDVLHAMSMTDELKARMAGSWSDYFVLESLSPILSYNIEIRAPDSLPLVTRVLKDEVKGSVTASTEKLDGVTVYKWKAKDVPRIFPEPSMPPYHTVVQRLIVSTIPDWQTVSKWYWSISKPHLDKATDAMKAAVDEIVKGQDCEDARIEAIFKFVSQKIRYMGITTEDVSPGYEPHDVNITFENKYGVCRDKAALLVAMLRMAGFDAYPVLIHAGPKKDIEAPMPYFNHAISCVRKSDGSYVLMDSTDETTSKLLPAYLCDKSYLVARPEGETLRTSPIVPASENLMKISTKGSLSPSGSLSASSHMQFEGINDNAYRSYLLKARPDERRLLFEGKLKALVKGASLKSLRVSPADLQDTSAPLTADLEFEVKDFLVNGGSEAMLPLPWLSPGFGTVNFILGETGLEKRRFPFCTEIACGGAETLEIDLGQGLGKALSTPKCKTVDSDTLKWTESVSAEGQALKASSAFEIKAVEFSPAQYLELREALKTVENDRRKEPIFASKDLSSAEPDVVFLDERVDFKLSSASSWTQTKSVKKKVLSYAGKKRHSEIHVNYNPVWESVSIKATVTSPKGEVKTLGPKELNTMDAAWVGSAPRYPAGKTLVASLPGVDVGSVIESEVVVETKGRSFLSVMESFQYYEPLESKSVSISFPKELLPSMKFSLPPDESFDGGTRLVWKAKDVAPVKPEDSLPPWWVFTRTLLASNGDWKAFSKEALSALEAASSVQPEAAKKALSLCEGAGSGVECLTRIRDFVAKSIRLGGPDFWEIPLSCMTPADKTLADGYGNSVDRAVLIASMLKAAGFKPDFVLASGYPPVAEVFAPIYYNVQASAFRSPLVRVELDGKIFHLNDTNQYDRLGALGHSGKQALDLRSGEACFLKAASEDLETSKSFSWSVSVEPDGSATLEKTVRFYGAAYGPFRQSYSEMTPEEFRRNFQELVADVAQSASPIGDLKADFSSYPGALSFKVSMPDFAVRDGGRLYFQLPGSGFEGLLRLRSESRLRPFYRSELQRSSVSYELRLPPSFKRLSIGPADFKWASGRSGSWVELDSSFNGGVLSASLSALFKPSVTPASEYGELKRLDAALSSPAMNTVLISE